MSISYNIKYNSFIIAEKKDRFQYRSQEKTDEIYTAAPQGRCPVALWILFFVGDTADIGTADILVVLTLHDQGGIARKDRGA